MATLFLTMLAGGTLGLTALCRAEQIAWRFFRVVAISASVVLGALFGLLLRDGAWHGTIAATVLLGVANVAAIVFVVGTSTEALYRPRFVRPVAAVGAVSALAAAGLLGRQAGIWPAGASAASLLALAGMVLSAAVVGSVTLATMLGHAYLTATKMTIAPLRRLAGLFGVAMIVRCVWVVIVSGGIAWSMLRAGTLETADLYRQTIMISIRLAAGLLVPLVFAYMVWETVRLRATQSATGILYFTMVLAYVGELTGLYLARMTGVPF